MTKNILTNLSKVFIIDWILSCLFLRFHPHLLAPLQALLDSGTLAYQTGTYALFHRKMYPGF